MPRKIRRVAVLGAGVMGTGIATHLAGAGLEVLLLDIVPPQLTDADIAAGITLEDPAFRSRFASSAAGWAVMPLSTVRISVAPDSFAR